jgi:hypothetical protein
MSTRAIHAIDCVPPAQVEQAWPRAGSDRRIVLVA